jgi:phosphomannomutase
MSEAPLILGVSGLRGIVGESLTPEVAVRYAGAFGGWLRERAGVENPLVSVGRDGRAGGEELARVVADALIDAGCVVSDCGVATTPSMGHEVDHCLQHAAVVLTASHNPAEWNGIKLLVSDEVTGGCDGSPVSAAAPSAAVAESIIERFHATPSRVSFPGGRMAQRGTPEGSHVADIEGEMAIAGLGTRGSDVARLRAVVDSVNCSGAVGTAEVSRRLGFECNQLFGDDSGVFPHTPEPTKENLSGDGGLCDAVPGLKADVGFAQDPDADRLAIVDEQGIYIGEEYTLVLCAVALMEARKGDAETARAEARGSLKPVFVVNLSTSRMIDDLAARYGAEVVRTPVGEANVVERMKQLKAEGRDVVMGGEGNGGVIWPEVTYVRDSLSAMALTLALMARTGKKVSELVAMVDAMGPGKKGYCILKRKAPLASKADAVPVVEHLARVYRGEADAVVDTQDGVRIDWPARGVWAHVRASNTEPIMRVIVEAPTEAQAQETARSVESCIAEV